ncbi:MAG: hypothetical protein R3F34_02615 [Planctomycetota bacterium]
MSRLEREDTSPCHTFRPGRHDPFNCSNSVIDGGACSDALASLCLDHGDLLSADDREAFAHAATLHADTYLKYACRDKGIPAQRAWALTGLASAWRLDPREEWREAALEALAILRDVQRDDGSFPYHPLEWGAEHAGASDASSFYQSRVTGFVAFALERFGIDAHAEPHRASIARGLDFLLGLQGPDGVKCGVVEAKPWYWGATYEVASHPFDVHAFARGSRTFERADLARAAHRGMAAWIAHQEPDGRPRSHLPGPGRERSYQCATFWASHACWAARALADWDDAPADAPRSLGVREFRATDLARIDTPGLTVWVRGARPPGNAMHGSPLGAGIVRCVDATGRELLPRCRLGGSQSGEWNGRAGLVSPARGLRAGAKDVRFSLWLARVALRRGAPLDALATPLRHVRRDVLAFAHPRASSGFDRAATLQVEEDRVVVEGALAHRDGERVAGSRFVRTVAVSEGGIQVDDRLLSRGAARGVAYRVPNAASADAEVDGEHARWRLG